MFCTRCSPCGCARQNATRVGVRARPRHRNPPAQSSPTPPECPLIGKHGTRRARCAQEPGLEQFGFRHGGRLQAILHLIPMRQAGVPWKGRFQNGPGLNFVQSELRRDVSGSTHGLRQTEPWHLAPRSQGKPHRKEETRQVPVQGALCCASTHCCTSSERGLFRFHMAGTWTSG